MPARVHSLFPASAAARLLACPGSYTLSLSVDAEARRASVYAAQGTLAHLVAETMLKTGTPRDHYKGRQFNVDGYVFEVTDDMLDAVEEYVLYAHSLKAVGFDMRYEVVVDPAELWRDKPSLPIDLFGTADCIAYNPEWHRLAVIDLKFGEGVAVDPEGNPQLLYYAAGALAQLSDETAKQCRQVNLTVVQPRLVGSGKRKATTWVTSPTYVRAWARDVLYPGVQTSLNDQGLTLKPGEHCRFCPAFRTCDGPKSMLLDRAAAIFAEAGPTDRPADPNLPDPLAGVGHGLSPRTLSDDKLTEMLDASLVVGPLIEELRDLAKQRLKAGRVLKGWQLEERRGNRKWPDKQDALVADLLGAVQRGEIAQEDVGDALVLMSPSKLEKTPVYPILKPHELRGEPSHVLTHIQEPPVMQLPAA